MIRKIFGIEDFDKETASVTQCGCHTAEHEAVLRYGKNWRKEYLANRKKERARKFWVLNKLFKDKP